MKNLSNEVRRYAFLSSLLLLRLGFKYSPQYVDSRPSETFLHHCHRHHCCHHHYHHHRTHRGGRRVCCFKRDHVNQTTESLLGTWTVTCKNIAAVLCRFFVRHTTCKSVPKCKPLAVTRTVLLRPVYGSLKQQL